MKVLLSKHKESGDIEFAPVYFNSTTKTVINLEYDLDFKEILYRIGNWFTRCWAIEYVVKEFVNICIFNLSSGSTYIELPNKLRNSVKGLINI